MATKRRTDYQVDEEALKRMMAGDVTALDKMASPAEAPETKSRPAPSKEKQEKNFAGSPKQQIGKVPMFLGSVLSDHLERYQDVINEIYNQEANQNPLEWKK